MFKNIKIAKSMLIVAFFLASSSSVSAKTNILLNCFVPSKHVW